MTDFSWWHVLAIWCGLLGFSNLEIARKRQVHEPAALLLSFAAGYLAYRHGESLWASGDDHSRVVVVALGFAPASLVMGFLWWRTEGVFHRLVRRVTTSTVLGLLALFVLRYAGSEAELALRFGLVLGIVSVLPWYSSWRWLQQCRVRRERRRDERERQEQEREEADRQLLLEQRQEDALLALVDELRK